MVLKRVHMDKLASVLQYIQGGQSQALFTPTLHQVLHARPKAHTNSKKRGKACDFIQSTLLCRFLEVDNGLPLIENSIMRSKKPDSRSTATSGAPASRGSVNQPSDVRGSAPHSPWRRLTSAAEMGRGESGNTCTCSGKVFDMATGSHVTSWQGSVSVYMFVNAMSVKGRPSMRLSAAKWLAMPSMCFFRSAVGSLQTCHVLHMVYTQSSKQD